MSSGKEEKKVTRTSSGDNKTGNGLLSASHQQLPMEKKSHLSGKRVTVGMSRDVKGISYPSGPYKDRVWRGRAERKNARPFLRVRMGKNV